MAVKIVYFGMDTCHRLQVLRASGFEVAQSVTPLELEDELASSDAPRAILFSDRDEEPALEVLKLVRAHAPLILFHDSNRNFVPSGFDLVVPNLTSPARWIDAIKSLITTGARTGEKTTNITSGRRRRLGIVRPEQPETRISAS